MSLLNRSIAPEARERLLRPAVALPVVLVLAIAARLYAFVGICRLDMFRYLELSNHVHLGGSLFDPQVFYASARLPLMVPLIWANGLFGYGELPSVGWQLLCSLGSVVFAYLLARELFDDLTAFGAGLLMAVFPLEVELATQLLPDAVEGAFILGSVYFAVLAAKREDRWLRWSLLSGAFIALAYFTRVNALVFLPGLLVAGAIVRPASWKRGGAVLGGIALTAAAMAIAFWAMSGDPLIDLHKTQEFYASYQESGFFVRDATFRGMVRNEPALVWLFRLIPIAVIGAVVRRDRSVALLSIWVIGFYIYLEWVSPLHGLDSSYRYIEPLVPPALILAAAGASVLASGERLWRLVTVAAVGLIVAALMVQTSEQVATRYSAHPRWRSMRTVAQLMVDNPEKSLYVDHAWHLYAVNYYSGFSLGRDTLEPPDAAVNEAARLFMLDEKQPAPGEDAWLLLSEKTPVLPPRPSLETTLPYSEGELGLYRAP